MVQVGISVRNYQEIVKIRPKYGQDMANMETRYGQVIAAIQLISFGKVQSNYGQDRVKIIDEE